MVVQESDLGNTFLLTATGQTSGYTAQTTFTDGNVRIRTNIAGVTFDLYWEKFSTTTCAVGTRIDFDTQNNVGFSGGARHTEGAGNTESIALTAEAVSNQGGGFLRWTSETPVNPSTPTNPTTALTICVPGFSGNGTREYVANYGVVAPVAAPQSVTTNEDIAKVITLSATDTDGNALTFEIVGGPTNGTLSAITGTSCTPGAPTTCTANVTYTPTANYNGSDSFTFRATEGVGSTPSNTATVSITVTAVNDAPSFTKGADQTVNEDAGAQTVAGWATRDLRRARRRERPDADVHVTDNNNPASSRSSRRSATNGTLTYTPGGRTPTASPRSRSSAAGQRRHRQRRRRHSATRRPSRSPSTRSTTRRASRKRRRPDGQRGRRRRRRSPAGRPASAPGPANETGQTLSLHRHRQHQRRPVLGAARRLADRHADLHAGRQRQRHGHGHARRPGQRRHRQRRRRHERRRRRFTITVTAVNDAPSFTKGADQTVNEDAGPQTVTGWATAHQRRPGERERPDARPSTSTSNNNAASSRRSPAVAPNGDADLHAGRRTPTAAATITRDVARQRRHRQRRRRHERRADVHDHRQRGQRRADLHQGRRPDGQRGRRRRRRSPAGRPAISRRPGRRERPDA